MPLFTDPGVHVKQVDWYMISLLEMQWRMQSVNLHIVACRVVGNTITCCYKSVALSLHGLSLPLLTACRCSISLNHCSRLC